MLGTRLSYSTKMDSEWLLHQVRLHRKCTTEFGTSLSYPTRTDSTRLLYKGMAHRRHICGVWHSVKLLDLDGFQMASLLSKGTTVVRYGVWHFVYLPGSYSFYLASLLRSNTREVHLRYLALR